MLRTLSRIPLNNDNNIVGQRIIVKCIITNINRGLHQVRTISPWRRCARGEFHRHLAQSVEDTELRNLPEITGHCLKQTRPYYYITHLLASKNVNKNHVLDNLLLLVGCQTSDVHNWTLYHCKWRFMILTITNTNKVFPRKLHKTI